MAIYPFSAHLTILANLGGVPCMRIATRKIRPPAHTKKMVHNNTPIKPTKGCQAGILSGVANLSVISIGVKNGIRDDQVEKLLSGSLATGK